MIATLGDDLRFAWLPKLNDVAGRPERDLAAWIASEEFQIYEPVEAKKFTLFVYEEEQILTAFAFEINRILSAAVETMLLVEAHVTPAERLGWSLVQTYYASFFAAHALMRMWGISCDVFDKNALQAVTKIAHLYSIPAPSKVSSGFYTLKYDPNDTRLKCAQPATSNDGPHETFWSLFDDKLGELAQDVLIKSAISSTDAQAHNATLEMVRSNLSFAGARKGAWLPKIRKSINYDLKWKVWYPYGAKPSFYKALNQRRSLWSCASLDQQLNGAGQDDLERFQRTCTFVVSLALESSAAMAARCSAGTSFLSYGALALLKLSRR